MLKNKPLWAFFIAGLLLWASPAYASGDEMFHRTTLLLIIIYIVAKTFGVLCEKIQIPSLVGELLAGIFIGNLHSIGIGHDIVREIVGAPFFRYAAELGVVFLLFLVGLESSLGSLLRAGADSFVTAVVGVVIPTVTGAWLVYALGLGGGIDAWFVGATFAATSVGITAKLLSQYNKLKTPTAQVILGAAIIDDVLGLMLLAGLLGVVATGSVSAGGLGLIVGKTVLFFAAAFGLGHYVMPHVFRLYPAIDQPGILTVIAVVIALGFSDLAYLAGLAPIVGAFTAGILLDEVQLKHSGGLKRETFEQTIKPVTDMLLPIFFVSIGLEVQLTTFSSWGVTGLVFLLVLVAFLGKAVCGIFSRNKAVDKLGVGLGMVPRGEVGLIFATYGMQNKILSPELYSVLVLVVLLTTIIGPLFLRLRIQKF